MRLLSLLSLVALLVLHAQGCADTSTFSDGGVDDAAVEVDTVHPDLAPIVDAYVNPCAPKPPPAVSGRVLSPNGTDPVAGASIYVPLAIEPLPSEVRCESCAVSGRFATVTYSGPDGSFRLERVPNARKFTLGIQKGYFRRVIEVEVPECAELALTDEQTTLPGKNKQYGADDTVPRIAVVSGVWDKLEKVLGKLGVLEREIYNGRDYGTGSDSIQSLLQNRALLRSYHLLFINCGTQFENLVTSVVGTERNNIIDYVQRGGRIFVTDMSYDFIEQTFPVYVDFYGSKETPADQPEEPNMAELGTKDVTITGDVLDQQMKNWLALPEIDALRSDGRIDLLGFDTGWALAEQVNEELGVKVWIEGEATWAGGKGIRPLTLSYDVLSEDGGGGCGRVLFSSYHTYGNAPVLLPQERVLEYLMLEMGSCIDLK